MRFAWPDDPGKRPYRLPPTGGNVGRNFGLNKDWQPPAEVEEVVLPGIPSLKPGLDLCDHCGFAAYYRVVVNIQAKQILDLCGHHFRENELAFISAGYVWEDKTKELR